MPEIQNWKAESSSCFRFMHAAKFPNNPESCSEPKQLIPNINQLPAKPIPSLRNTLLPISQPNIDQLLFII